MTNRLNRKIYENLMFWVFVLPVFLPFIIFFIFPFTLGIFYSLFKWNGISPTMQYVGFKNYMTLFKSDPDYYTSLWFSLRYVVLTVILTNIFALFLTLLLDTKLAGRNFLRAAFFLPNVVSAIISGFLWQFIFGQGSKSLYDLTGSGIFQTDWLGGSGMAIVSMAIVALWQSAGYIMVIYLAGLQSIDESLVEAAEIDGASGIKKFFNITLPLIMPSITVNLFMTMSQAFRTFDLNIALTNGGPGRSTLGLALDIYKEGFSNNAAGYAAAKAVIFFLMVFAITLVQIRFTKGREVQY